MAMADAGTHLPLLEVSLGAKDHANIKILAELGIELETLWSENRDLTNAPTIPTLHLGRQCQMRPA